jgi:hypothetical protein
VPSANVSFDVEYDSLRELSDLLPTFSEPESPNTRETKHFRVVALARRVRDQRASEAVELLVSLPRDSQEYRDQIGNAVRIVGAVMTDL